MKLLLLGLSLSLSLLSFASTVDENIRVAKERYQEIGDDKNVRCIFPQLKLKSSKIDREKNHYVSRFILEDFEFDVTYPFKKRARPTLVGVSQPLEILGKKNGYFINFPFQRLSHAQRSVVDKYNLSSLKCLVEDFRDIPIEINSKKNHINMHPHWEYDKSGNTRKAAQKYLNDKSFQSFVLLDASGTVGLFQNYSIDDIQVEPTLETQIFTASSGHARFNINVDDVDMVYTGGYINFCIALNNNSLVVNFLQQSRGGALNMIFDASGLSTQKTSFKKNKAMDVGFFAYVQQYFKSNPIKAKSFKTAHKDYIKKHIEWNRHLYKEVKLDLISDGANSSEVIRGNGDRNFDVVVKYINE